MSNIYGIRGNLVSTRNDNTNNNHSLGFIKYNDNRQQIILYNTDLNYNPSTQTLTVPNISGTVVGGAISIAITETADDTYYYLTFIDSSGSEKTLRANTSGISYNPDKDELQVSDIIGTGNCDFLTFTGNGSNLTEVNSETIDISDAGENINYYLVFTNSSGSGKTLNINETASNADTFTYNPFTNKLSVLRVYCGYCESENFIGNGSQLTNIQTSALDGVINNGQLQYSIITIGTTAINLGNTVTELFGLTDFKVGTLRITDGAIRDTDGTITFDTTNLVGLGRLGFGVDSFVPEAQLDVGSIDEYVQGIFKNRLATNPGQIVIRNIAYTEQIQILSKYDGGDNHILAYNDVSGNANLKLNNSMMILANGNVGIGIVVPQYKCHLGTTGDNYGFIHSSGVVELGTYISAGSNAYFGTKSNSSLRLMTNTSTRMIIDNNGNVGIGLAAPSQKLDVFGKSVFGSDSTFNAILHLGSVLYNSNQNFSKNCMYHDTSVNPYGLFIANTNSGNVANKEASILFGIADTANNVKTGISICARANDVNVVSSDLVFNTKSIFPIQNGYSVCSESMRINSLGNVGIGIAPDPAYKLEVLGLVKCGNAANSDTALDIEISSSYAYGMYIGGWSTGGRTNGNATIEMSHNLHIDSPSNGPIGAGNIYLNNYTLQSTFIRNRVDISDKRIKKDIVSIETPEQFNDTFEIIKKVGSYKYKYRDIYRENDLEQYGFIAQEVQAHYPVAYKLAGDNLYLPNIMETLNFTYKVGEENEYTFNIEGYDLDVNIKYIFYAFREGVEQFDYLENIKPTTNNKFIYTPTIIKNQEPPTYIKLVLVGTYTDDKLGVSKDKLFQLGFAGVRGLIEENETLKSRIDILEENQKKIIQKLNELINPDGWFKNSI